MLRNKGKKARVIIIHWGSDFEHEPTIGQCGLCGDAVEKTQYYAEEECPDCGAELEW